MQEHDIFGSGHPPVFNIRMRQRLGAIAAAASICAALTWILSPLSSAQVNGDAGAKPEASRLLPDGGKVYHQGTKHYHWRADCPLACATPQKPNAHNRRRERSTMLRRDAEKLMKIPCGFCGDDS